MKTPIRYQSRLLVRRSYKPGRRDRQTLGIRFSPAPRFAVNIRDQKNRDAPPAEDAEVFAYSI